MEVRIVNYKDYWREIKDNALFTIHKKNGKYPDSKWKKEMLLSEHSPIRTGRLIVEIYDIPEFVIMHLVRHHVGFTPFVSTLRDDRVSYENGEIPNRETKNNLRFEGNFQALINISRKRLCSCASKETREVWEAVKKEISNFEPELAQCMVRECVYRGFCPEMEKVSCKYCTTSEYEQELEEYMMEV